MIISAHSIYWVSLILLLSISSCQREYTAHVFLVAGSVDGSSGLTNDMSTAARFNSPKSITLDNDKNMYVVDEKNYAIRKITPNGNVSTFVSKFYENGVLTGFEWLEDVYYHTDGYLYVSDKWAVRKISLSGQVSVQFNLTKSYCGNIRVLPDNSYFFCTNYEKHNILRISPSGNQEIFVGSMLDEEGIGVPGYVDGVGTNAQLRRPQSITAWTDGVMYVSDSTNHKIRKITANGEINTIAGAYIGTINGYRDGQGTFAWMFEPRDLVFDKRGNIYFTDSRNDVIRMINATNYVSTVAGVKSAASFADGIGTQAKFNGVSGMVIDDQGHLYVTEKKGHRIRKIILCSDAQIFVNETRTCICKAGYYPIAEKYNDCDPCPLGTFKNANGNFNCSSCPPSQISLPNRQGCVFCPSGKYLPPNSNFCIDCPENAVCEPSFFSCLPGYELNSKRDGCQSCQQGSFKDKTGNDVCSVCPAGTESSQDRKSCVACTANTFRPHTEIPACIPCPANSVCTSNSFECMESFEYNSRKGECTPLVTLGNGEGNRIFTGYRTFTLSDQRVTQYSTKSVSRNSNPANDKSENSNETMSLTSIVLIGCGCVIVPILIWFLIPSKKMKPEHSKGKTTLTSVDNRMPSDIITGSTLVSQASINSQTSLTLPMGAQSSGNSSHNVNSNNMVAPSSNSMTKSFHFPTTITATQPISNITLVGYAGLCVPGFLQFQGGLDFRIEKLVCASSGGGTVHVGSAFTDKLSIFGRKIIIKEAKNLEKSQRLLDAFYQEIAIMYLLKDNRNIARLLGFCDKPYSILMKYYPKGSLFNFLMKSIEIKTKRMIFEFIFDIAKAIGFMNTKGIAHCDLKVENVLLDVDPISKQVFCVLTDFGISCPINDSVKNVAAFKDVQIKGASLYYASPELLAYFRNKTATMVGRPIFTYNPVTSDVYSFSILVLEIITRAGAWKRVLNRSAPKA